VESGRVIAIAAMLATASLGITSCTQRAPEPIALEIASYGLINSAEVDDDGNPVVVAGTSCIPLKLGTSFGVQFEAQQDGGAAENGRAAVRLTWHYPPGSTRPPIVQGWTVPLGAKTTASYTLEHDWELIPGEWRIEISDGTRKLAERVFELHDPNEVCE
jgi:hypothetical protein